MTLKLNNPIWNTPQRRAAISKAVFEAGTDFAADVRERMKKSVPKGKVYRRAAIIQTASKRNNVPGLRTIKPKRKRISQKKR